MIEYSIWGKAMNFKKCAGSPLWKFCETALNYRPVSLLPRNIDRNRHLELASKQSLKRWHRRRAKLSVVTLFLNSNAAWVWENTTQMVIWSQSSSEKCWHQSWATFLKAMLATCNTIYFVICIVCFDVAFCWVEVLKVEPRWLSINGFSTTLTRAITFYHFMSRTKNNIQIFNYHSPFSKAIQYFVLQKKYTFWNLHLQWN